MNMGTPKSANHTGVSRVQLQSQLRQERERMQIATEQVLGNPVWSKAQTGGKDAMNMGTPKAAKHQE